MIKHLDFLDHSKHDWSALGLRCGVEIHQQLLTERKLFCHCPAGCYTTRNDAMVVRHMRPTLSELGEYDGTALMEFKTKKNITYLLNRETVCTYEMDDTPPFEVNREAIDIGIDLSLSLNCQIVGELHVIRKQYLDGSIPTGFQRTAIVGLAGEIPFRGRTLHLFQVSVEEDSCREVADRGHDVVFRTDRLSMPLAELVTAPEMLTPDDAAAAVTLLSRVMRNTGRVRRGAGATRQDVNVSVTGGTRVEIKGVPSIALIPRLVANEGLRQRALLDIQDHLRELGLSRDGFDWRAIEVSQLFTGTSCQPLREALDQRQSVVAVRLSGLREITRWPVGPHRRFVDELAGRVRVIACLDETPVILHGENYAAHGVSEREWREVRRRMRAKAADAVLLVRGPAADVETAVKEIIIRMREAFDGVPSETRQVMRHGATDFERILPGPDRMYPDTDSAPTAISDDWLARLRTQVASREPIWQRDDRLRAAGLAPEIVDELALSSRFVLYEKAVRAGLAPRCAAAALTTWPRALRRAGLAVDAVRDEVREALLLSAARGEILPAALPLLFRAAARDVALDASALIAATRLTPLTAPEAETLAREALAAVPPPRVADPAARLRYFMGAVMPRLRGRYPGREARALIARLAGCPA